MIEMDLLYKFEQIRLRHQFNYLIKGVQTLFTFIPPSRIDMLREMGYLVRPDRFGPESKIDEAMKVLGLVGVTISIKDEYTNTA